MTGADVPSIDRIVTLLAALMLVLQFLLAGQRLLSVAIRLFALQSLVLSVLAAVVARSHGQPHIFISAALTLGLKVVALPVVLRRVAGQPAGPLDAAPFLNVPSLLLASGGLTLVAAVVAQPFAGASLLAPSVLAVAVALMLLGFFLMVVQRNAIGQVLGLLTAENGLFLLAVSLTSGMPLLVELGVFFDIFVAVLVLGLLVTRLRKVEASIDVSRLRRLRG